MVSSPQKFCEQCGTPISTTTKFCGNCGAPIGQSGTSPASETPPPAAPASSILSIIPSVELKKGLFGSDAFNLIVTADQLIFARVTTKLIQTVAKEAKQVAKSQGKGFFGQWGATMQANNALCERYYQMSPDVILQQYPKSFVIRMTQIQKIRIQIRGFNYNEEGNNPDRMVIHATSGKMTFILKGMDGGETKKRLKPLFGKRIK